MASRQPPLFTVKQGRCSAQDPEASVDHCSSDVYFGVLQLLEECHMYDICIVRLVKAETM